MNYIISTDSSCDLPLDLITNNNIHLFKLQLEREGITLADDLGEKNYTHEQLYDDLKNGAVVKTSLTSVGTFAEKFEECAKANLPIIYMGMSSGGSGTFQSATLAKRDVLEKYPNAKIHLVDTLAGSGGVGYLILKSIRFKDQKASFDELVSKIESIKSTVMHLLTVNDLMYLSRGGRLPKKYAVLGTLLNLKPILYITNKGTLEVLSKERGRKKSLNNLIMLYKKFVEDASEPVVLTYTGSKKEAEELSAKLQSDCGAKEIILCRGHASMGVHTGPDTIGVFFKATQKEPTE